MPRGSQNGPQPGKCPCCPGWDWPQGAPAAPAPWQGENPVHAGRQNLSSTCTGLVAVLHCWAPWCRSDCTEHHSSLEAATGQGVQAAIAGCMQVGWEAFELHAAPQALCLLLNPAQPGRGCSAAGSTMESVTHTELQTFYAPCTPLLSLFFPILGVFPTQLSCPPPCFLLLHHCSRAELPTQPHGDGRVCWPPKVQQQAQGLCSSDLCCPELCWIPCWALGSRGDVWPHEKEPPAPQCC